MTCFGKVVLLLTLCFIGSLLTAETVQIGTGMLYNQCLPVEPMMSYSYSQSIYNNNEIGFGGLISAIGFQYRITSSTFLNNTNQFSIYMGTVNRDRYHSLTDWVHLDSLQLVFQGNLQSQWFSAGFTGNGWLTIPLSIAYTYSCSGNLVIAVDENAPGYGNMADDFYCTASSLPQSLEIHSQTVNPDPNSPPPAYNNNPFNPLSVRPNLKLEIQPVIFTPHSPVPMDSATEIALNTSLTWQSNAQSWDVLFAPINQSMQLVASSLTEPSWTLQNSLAMFTGFHWQVIAYDGNNTYTGPVWTFTTRGEELTAPQNLQAMTIGKKVRLDWQAPMQGNIVSYRIYRNQQLIDEVQELVYYDNTGQPGCNYWYYVVGVNSLCQTTPPSTSVSVTIPGSLPLYQMSFDDQEDFALTIPDWTQYDLDHSTTGSWINDFPHVGDPMSWIVFNPMQTEPPMTTLTPYSGTKMMLCIDSVNPPNNDWLISPRITIQNSCEISFWVRSVTDDFGLERLRFLISSSDCTTTSFLPLSVEPFLSIPVAWTQVVYNLSAYAGQQVYFAWQCKSWDAFALCLDEIVITQNVSNQDDTQIPMPNFRIYPNPAKDMFIIDSKDNTPFEVGIYNIKGQQIHQSKEMKSFEWKNKLPTGIYLIRIEQQNRHYLNKLVVVD